MDKQFARLFIPCVSPTCPLLQTQQRHPTHSLNEHRDENWEIRPNYTAVNNCFQNPNAQVWGQDVPFVIHAFVPLRTHLSPFNVAVQEAAPASDPFPGSLKAKQPTCSPWRNGCWKISFCSGVANLLTGPKYNELFTLRIYNEVSNGNGISINGTVNWNYSLIHSTFP